MIEGIVKVSKKLENGMHEGVIIGLSERTDPYKYLDIDIEIAGDKDKRTIKVSFPNNIMAESKLGQLLIRFGATLVEGETLQLDPILVGKECTFTSVTEGKYVKVLAESLKPK